MEADTRTSWRVTATSRLLPQSPAGQGRTRYSSAGPCRQERDRKRVTRNGSLDADLVAGADALEGQDAVEGAEDGLDLGRIEPQGREDLGGVLVSPDEAGRGPGDVGRRGGLNRGCHRHRRRRDGRAGAGAARSNEECAHGDCGERDA